MYPFVSDSHVVGRVEGGSAAAKSHCMALTMAYNEGKRVKGCVSPMGLSSGPAVAGAAAGAGTVDHRDDGFSGYGAANDATNSAVALIFGADAADFRGLNVAFITSPCACVALHGLVISYHKVKSSLFFSSCQMLPCACRLA